MTEKKVLSLRELQGLKFSLEGIKKDINLIDDPVAKSPEIRDRGKFRALEVEQRINFNRLVNEEIASRLEK